MNERISIPGYNIVRCDRLGKDCGGVAVYVREDLPIKLIDSSPGTFDGCPEFIIFEVGGSNSMPPVLIGVMYRAPRLQLPFGFWTSWARSSPFYSHSILMGDFNINSLNDNCKYRRHLRSQADLINSRIIPFGPTHHTAISHTWIDHILVSRQSVIESFAQVTASLSGHDLVMVDVQI